MEKTKNLKKHFGAVLCGEFQKPGEAQCQKLRSVLSSFTPCFLSVLVKGGKGSGKRGLGGENLGG